MENISGDPMQILYKKLRSLKKVLQVFSQETYGDVSLKVQNLRAELQSIQSRLMGNEDDEQLLKQELEIRQRLREACLIEEAHLRQKSRVQWLKGGNQNTAFFFRSIKQKQSKENIKVLHTEDGQRLKDYDSISHEATCFYQKLLGQEDKSVGCLTAVQMESIVQKRIPTKKTESLAADITDDKEGPIQHVW